MILSCTSARDSPYQIDSALGYCPPEEFERKSEQRNDDAGVAASQVSLFDY